MNVSRLVTINSLKERNWRSTNTVPIAAHVPSKSFTYPNWL